MRNTLFVTGLITGLVVLLSGCTSWETDKGVEAIWRQPDREPWSVGRTTEEDVISALGPPSQMIALDEETVYYYMREKSKGRAYIFILWNSSQQTVEYDRAVFFFDEQGVLLKYAYSREDLADHAEN